MKLTEEQLAVVNSRSNALRVIAFAGAGKTSTLKAYADARPREKILYLAYNKSIQLEAKSKFPENVKCVTTHGLAFASIGKKFKHKLASNIRPDQAARALGLNIKNKADLGLAHLALKNLTAFFNSDSSSIEEFSEVVGITSNVGDKSARLWRAMTDPDNGDLLMLHDAYLKLYQLNHPKLNYDCILFDEAQDANPATLSIVKSQSSAKIFVGDPHQQIYQFRGAQNAMDDESLSDTLYLTESFRFDEKIASIANSLLKIKGEKNR